MFSFLVHLFLALPVDLGDLFLMKSCYEGNIKQLTVILWGVWPLGKQREILHVLVKNVF